MKDLNWHGEGTPNNLTDLEINNTPSNMSSYAAQNNPASSPTKTQTKPRAQEDPITLQTRDMRAVKGLMIGIIVAIILLIGIVVFMFYQYKLAEENRGLKGIINSGIGTLEGIGEQFSETTDQMQKAKEVADVTNEVMSNPVSRDVVQAIEYNAHSIPDANGNGLPDIDTIADQCANNWNVMKNGVQSLLEDKEE